MLIGCSGSKDNHIFREKYNYYEYMLFCCEKEWETIDKSITCVSGISTWMTMKFFLEPDFP